MFQIKTGNSGSNTSMFQFRCFEDNIETSELFQNDSPSFASSSKISSHSSATLSHTIESIKNDSVGVTFKLVGGQYRALG